MRRPRAEPADPDIRAAIRPARVGEAEALSALARRSKASWGYPEEWLVRWREDLTLGLDAIGRGAVLVAEIQREVAGLISKVQHAEGWEIDHLWVEPRFMGRGVGLSLISACLEGLIPPTRVRVVSDPNARGFYESCGFSLTGWEESWPPGRRLPVLVLSLGDSW